MILGLIRRDEGLRRSPPWLVIMALNATLLVGVLTSASLWRRTAAPTLALLLVGWLGPATYLAVGPVRTRASRLDLALPLPARRLALAHLLAVFSGAAVIALFTVGALLASDALLTGQLTAGLSASALGALLLAHLALATALLLAPAPLLRRIPLSAANVAWSVAVLLGTFLLMVAASRLGAWGALPAAAAAILAGWIAWRRGPAAFTEAPTAPAPRRAAALSVAGARGAATSRPSGRRAVVRALGGGGLDLANLALALVGGVFWGVIWGRYAAEPLASGSMFWLTTIWGAYMLFTLLGPRFDRLHAFDPLPLSRGRLFAAIVGCYLSLLLAGAALGFGAAAHSAARVELVQYEWSGRLGAAAVAVPTAHCEIAWDGRPPTIVAPWGEARTPMRHPLWRGAKAALYAKFSTPAGSSREFVAWQLSRAVQAVYGAAIAPDEIARRFLAAGPDGRVLPRGERLTLLRDNPQLKAPVDLLTAFAVMVLVVSGALVCLAAFLSAYRPGVSPARRAQVYWGLLALFLVLVIGHVLAAMARLAPPWLLQALMTIPLRKLGQSTAGTLTVVVGGVALTAVAYWLAERSFRRMEIPLRPTRFALIQWMHESD